MFVKSTLLVTGYPAVERIVSAGQKINEPDAIFLEVMVHGQFRRSNEYSSNEQCSL